MPLYEQKLISPLAVRFTQQHIRPTFRDGRLLEDSLREIKATPGKEGYDVILEAPFPSIEIIRWCQELADGSHWFSLDNRRLQCLQRAALALWPRRCAVVVDLLYAEPGSVKRKCDTLVCGRSVSIGLSGKGPELCRWDWREQVELARRAQGELAAAAFGAITKDDTRESVAQLLDAPDEGGSLMRLLAAQTPVERLLEGCPTPSTGPASAEASEDESFESEDCDEASEAAGLAAVKRGLEGVWYGGQGESYKFRFGAETEWSCLRQDEYGSRTFTASYDQENDCVWWGTTGSYFFSAEEIAQEPDEIKMYAVDDIYMQRPRFVWHRRGCGRAAVSSRAAPQAVEGQRAAAAPSVSRQKQGPQQQGTLEAAAMAELEGQLREPSNGGFVHIRDWNSRYAPELGSLRAFLQRHPDRFRVVPARGGRFTVVLATPGGSSKAQGGAQGRRNGRCAQRQ